MAEALRNRAGRTLQDRKILEGYLLWARKTQGLPDKSGLSPAMQSPVVRGSVRLTAVVLDFPAYLCLPGRYLVNGGFYSDRGYVQSLGLGRDSYIPKSIDQVLEPQINPLTLAGTYQGYTLGSVNPSGRLLATRLWGVGQPFVGAGCMYGFGAVYLSTNSDVYALSWASQTDSFVYRLNVLTPTYVRYVTTDGQQVQDPPSPTGPAMWTIQIGESVLAAVGATAFVRKPAPPAEDYTAGWEFAQYPWITFSEPKPFINDDGQPGFKLTACAQVVFDQGGPYYDVPESDFQWGDSPQFKASPAGARCLWIGRVELSGTQASITRSYAVNPLSSGDADRAPTQYPFEDGSNPTIPVYASNVFYKTTPVVLDTGEAVVVAVSYAYKRYPGDPADFPLNVDPNESWMFCDVHWFSESGRRTQNISKTLLRKLSEVETDEGDRAVFYEGGLVEFDATENEHRFAIGSATDGTYVVAPVFSSFKMGATPRLNIIVATADGATVPYSAVPGFAMSMGAGGDETVAMGLIDQPEDTPENHQRFWGWQTGDGQVSYIGNDRFAFYISTEWDETPPVDYNGYSPKANLAIAVYYRKANTVSVAGVISETRTPSLNFVGANVNFGSLTQNILGDRLGRIEVVRPESDGYVLGGDTGHPATLIATRGWGAPAISIAEEAGKDIKDGMTWISYDSGATWTQFLDYGSPAGAFHCGNIAQARTVPVVRV